MQVTGNTPKTFLQEWVKESSASQGQFPKWASSRRLRLWVCWSLLLYLLLLGMLWGLKFLNTRKIKVTQNKCSIQLTDTVFPVVWSVKNIWVASDSNIQLNSKSLIIKSIYYLPKLKIPQVILALGEKWSSNSLDPFFFSFLSLVSVMVSISYQDFSHCNKKQNGYNCVSLHIVFVPIHLREWVSDSSYIYYGIHTLSLDQISMPELI